MRLAKDNTVLGERRGGLADAVVHLALRDVRRVYSTFESIAFCNTHGCRNTIDRLNTSTNSVLLQKNEPP